MDLLDFFFTLFSDSHLCSSDDVDYLGGGATFPLNLCRETEMALDLLPPDAGTVSCFF
jgi:hypothetical protein